MKRLVTAAEMRSMDEQAIAGGVPGAALMENAGRGVAEAILEHFSDLEDARVVVLAGKGNNGGDGFVTARLLRQSDMRPLVALVGGAPGELQGDAAWAYRGWEEMGGETTPVTDDASWNPVADEIRGADLVVDALLGTGSTGAPRGMVETAVRALDLCPAPVVSIDIPTGVNADTGEVAGACVQADLTVTMALPKRGHILYPGRAYVGDLHWVDIGIPLEALESGEGLRAFTVEPMDALALLPQRHPEMHKGDRGRLLVVGGSAGLTGAVALAAQAAVRAGAGLVTAGVPLSLNDVLEAKVTEAMTLPLPELEARALSRDAFDAIALFQPGRLSALAVGPGIGRHASTVQLVRRILQEVRLPTVLDADGLHAFAGEADRIRECGDPGRLILTPHPGEFAALTGADPGDVDRRRLEISSEWARRLGTVIVLKGAPTVIADPGREAVIVNPTGSEALATGGTGDVLTGFIAGFLTQGLDPLDAALLGTYLHGYTADYVVEEWGSGYGLKAGDLIDYFPMALGWFVSPPEELEELD